MSIIWRRRQKPGCSTSDSKFCLPSPFDLAHHYIIHLSWEDLAGIVLSLLVNLKHVTKTPRVAKAPERPRQPR